MTQTTHNRFFNRQIVISIYLRIGNKNQLTTSSTRWKQHKKSRTRASKNRRKHGKQMGKNMHFSSVTLTAFPFPSSTLRCSRRSQLPTPDLLRRAVPPLTSSLLSRLSPISSRPCLPSRAPSSTASLRSAPGHGSPHELPPLQR